MVRTIYNVSRQQKLNIWDFIVVPGDNLGHKCDSNHWEGRAVDLRLFDTRMPRKNDKRNKEIKKAFRNEGVQEYYGPGEGWANATDHNDHWHIGWKGPHPRATC